MSIYTRSDSKYFWCRFTVRGHRIRESTGIINKPENETRADEYEVKRKAEVLEKIKAKPQHVKVWQNGVLNWLSSPSIQQKKSLDTDKSRLVYLNTFLRDKPLTEIDDEIMQIALKDKLKRDEDNNPLPFQPTANRFISLVQSILNFNSVNTKLASYPEQTKRIRWITEKESHALIFELRKNAPHLGNMAEFTLATGLRESNCRLLKWSQVDIERKTAWFYGDEMKGKRDLGVPLNDDAIRVLKRCAGANAIYVFTYKNAPVAKCSTKAWNKAKLRAGINDFRWHDLRHTWASWHVQRGTTLAKLMELGGWASYEMVLKYAHLCTDHLKDDAERVNRARPVLSVVK